MDNLTLNVHLFEPFWLLSFEDCTISTLQF